MKDDNICGKLIYMHIKLWANDHSPFSGFKVDVGNCGRASTIGKRVQIFTIGVVGDIAYFAMGWIDTFLKLDQPL